MMRADLTLHPVPIHWQRLHHDATAPLQATPGAACWELFVQREIVLSTSGYIHKRRFGTGIAVALPPGYTMLIFSRSGHGFAYNVRLSNCVGVIDSDYRGEILVDLIRSATMDFPEIGPGSRIAQAMILPLPPVVWIESGVLPDTQRGAGGFGSTGA